MVSFPKYAYNNIKVLLLEVYRAFKKESLYEFSFISRYVHCNKSITSPSLNNGSDNVNRGIIVAPT